jgi:DNA helicase HerA-like ATPase
MTNALEALRSVDFSGTRPLESIWSDDNGSAGGPNQHLIDSIVSQFFRETESSDVHPKGGVLIGQSGIGKTHLVGLLRQRVWQSGGWFVLLDVLGLTDFWRSAALSFLTSLLREMPGGRRQFEAILAGVARRFKVEKEVETAFNRRNIEPRKIIDLLLKGLIKADMPNTLRHQDVFRALSLLRSVDLNVVSLAHSWLQGYDADEQARAALGFHAPPPSPVELIRGMSWIMSLAGPTLVAVDQIDGVVNPSSIAVQGEDLGGMQGLGEVLAAGLLQLHDVQRRGKTIIACLFDSWKVLEERGLTPFRERFDDPIAMQGMNNMSAVRALIVNRLSAAFQTAQFAPPFASWPFSEAAMESAASVGMMPRTILTRCDAFRRTCLARGSVKICDTLLAEKPDDEPRISPPNTLGADHLRIRETVDISELIAPDDNGGFGRLLRDVFELYTQHIDPDEAIGVESKGDPAQKIPPLHGRLTFTYHDEGDREQHFCFRALEHSHAISFQARLRAALTASGISNRIADRYLLLVRRSPVPSGSKTKQLFDTFEKSGGVLINPSDDDLRTFVAMRAMREEAVAKGTQDSFETWLRDEKPLYATAFFKKAGLSPPPNIRPPPPRAEAKPATYVTAASESVISRSPKKGTLAQSRSNPSPADAIPIGQRMTLAAEPVSLATTLLPRHTAIIAGSGSGKTVLLRRLVEEATLAGIPAIVIDPNNDLSRLGDPWPQRPAAFTPEDDAKAQRYHETVDVVVWTPGVHAGNPLFLPAMPDFASVGDDRDERQQAVEMAAETLGPLAGAKNALQRGVLVEALRHFASSGEGGLGEFTALLSDLPEGLSLIGNASKLAAGLADQLHAAVATNPLLRAEGPILNPKLLFFGPDPQRVRLSVVNLSGLASDAAREDFINRLQMTLFGWIKRNPSSTGLLYVVDEAQNFLPSQKPSLSLGSGLKLVAQARKYGLGMIVATQAPRGIHNQVVSNCTTQFLGKQSAPATIGAAQEIIAARGGNADDLGRLKAGEFYFSTEGAGKPGKVRTPICLSYHPPNPPAPDEVIARAKRSNPTSKTS